MPEKDGHPTEPQNIENPHSLIDEIHETISSRVSPVITPESTIAEFDGKTILGLSITNSDKLHSIALDMDQPVFPVRHGPQTRYLSGEEVTERIGSTQSSESDDEDETDFLRLPDEVLESDQESYFIEAPDGHISDICVFSNNYYPEHPKRIVLRSDYISENRAEDIFANLDRIFDLSIGDANYTINESNGAWIGKGCYGFVRNLRSRHERHRRVIESGYNLKQYGNEQAILIADIGGIYPESTVV
ncbi:hypothetical protein, partial [Halorubrum sp. Atlit-26R]|uniref:hypothetical protein n=1 Tax=Halorubrum sp. Atlit-26R TaxID=2282128 RepID=UPI001F18F7C2